jgi:hypothetical protein
MERPAQSKIIHNIYVWSPVAKRYIPAAARWGAVGVLAAVYAFQPSFIYKYLPWGNAKTPI